MNRTRLIEIMLWLEGGAQHQTIKFDMTKGVYIESKPLNVKKPTACVTACCIAGAAVQFFEPEYVREHIDEVEDNEGELPFVGYSGVFEIARALLDLNAADATELFTPKNGIGSGYGGSYAEFNDPAWASRTIAYLLATGKVDWEATRGTG